MRQIATLSLREVTRLRQRFRGGTSPLTVVILLGALALAVLAFRETSLLGNGLYRVGVAPDAPAIRDSKFAVVAADPARGRALVEQRALDAYVDGARVFARPDDKSLYAVGALKRYLEKAELARLSATYDRARAFPLRVEINYGSIAENETGATPKAIVIPSLMTPPAPFAYVIVALLYVLPITFISVFFTSSFMDEKINRRLTILMSAPVTPLQIIVGKMLPYALFALTTTAVLAYATQAEVWLAFLIYTPTILFVFSIYLMVPLFYRTFRDTTFISMLVTTLMTAYLVFPAMFIGISDLAFMSPLTLAVKMYRHEAFGWQEYLFPSAPMLLIFGLAVYAGTRLLNEEFLMGYRPITRKLADAIFLVLDRAHPYASVALFSALVIPIVYVAQLGILVVSTNLPLRLMLGGALVASALVEEIAKSASIVTLVEHRLARSTRQVLALAFLSALGFLIGEKLLVLFSVSVVSQTILSAALFSTGFLLVPLVAHFVFTALVCVLNARARVPYPIAVGAGVVVHAIYNVIVTQVAL